MIHIHKTRSGKFQVTNLAKNGEVLKSSEVLNTKQSCWDNIIAELDECYDHVPGRNRVMVQDDTAKTRVIYQLYRGSEWIINDFPKKEPRYVPGKNSKKKK